MTNTLTLVLLNGLPLLSNTQTMIVVLSTRLARMDGYIALMFTFLGQVGSMVFFPYTVGIVAEYTQTHFLVYPNSGITPSQLGRVTHPFSPVVRVIVEVRPGSKPPITGSGVNPDRTLDVASPSSRMISSSNRGVPDWSRYLAVMLTESTLVTWTVADEDVTVIVLCEAAGHEGTRRMHTSRNTTMHVLGWNNLLVVKLHFL